MVEVESCRFAAARWDHGLRPIPLSTPTRRFSLLDAVYGLVLAAALWMTIYMDYPGKRWLQ
jgi:hypothetical protein